MTEKNITKTETTAVETVRELTRANRIAVQSIPTGFKADFYRTHRHLATLISTETAWVADESANKSAQRESFRQFAIEHSADIGILWNPTDLRDASNVRKPKYESDADLMEDAVSMMNSDMDILTTKCPYGVSMLTLNADLITPMTHTAKGYDLSKMGVIDGKYERTGNWAWAEIEMCLTLTKDGQEIYYMTTVQLVSGQLKKPHITQTSFNEAVKESLKDAGLWVEESKEEVKEEAKEESKPKKTSKKSKKSEAKVEG